MKQCTNISYSKQCILLINIVTPVDRDFKSRNSSLCAQTKKHKFEKKGVRQTFSSDKRDCNMPIGKFKGFKFLFSSANNLSRDDVVANYSDDSSSDAPSHNSTSTSSGNGKDKKRGSGFGSTTTTDPRAYDSDEEDEMLEDYLDMEDIVARCKELADYHLIQLFVMELFCSRL